MCPRGDFCPLKPQDAKEGAHTHYVLCIKCLRVIRLIKQLGIWLNMMKPVVMKKIDDCKYKFYLIICF